MKALILLTAGIVCGCASAPEPDQPPKGFKRVKLESNPPGARVFITYGTSHKQASQSAGDYLGTTPCTADIATQPDGSFTITKKIAFVNNFGEPRTALLVAEREGVTITNIYHASAFARRGDQVPAAVLFNFER